MKINLGQILARSWQIIWNYKILWIFGIFAGFASGHGSGGNGGSNSSNRNNPAYQGDPERILAQVTEFFQRYMLIIIAVCLALAILSFLFYALGMMGRIGMLKGVYKAEEGASSLIFAELWSESAPYFWRFFGLNFLVGLAFLVVLLPFIALAVATAGVGIACLLPLICLLVPIGWAVNIVLEQAQAAIVAEDLGMFDGFKRGWEIAKSDILGMIVLSLVLGIGGGIIGFIIILPVIVAVIPIVVSMGLRGYQEGGALPPAAWVSIVCFGVYLPVLFILNGVVTAYIKTAWALAYRQLTKPAGFTSNAPTSAQADA